MHNRCNLLPPTTETASTLCVTCVAHGPTFCDTPHVTCVTYYPSSLIPKASPCVTCVTRHPTLTIPTHARLPPA